MGGKKWIICCVNTILFYVLVGVMGGCGSKEDAGVTTEASTEAETQSTEIQITGAEEATGSDITAEATQEFVFDEGNYTEDVVALLEGF